MQPTQKRKFGRIDLDVTAFAFGTAPVGNFLRESDEETSTAMFDTAWNADIRLYDTAPSIYPALARLWVWVLPILAGCGAKVWANSAGVLPPRREWGRSVW